MADFFQGLLEGGGSGMPTSEQVRQVASSAGDTTLLIVEILFIVAVVVGIFLWWMNMKNFRHTIIIRSLTGTKKLIYQDKYKYFITQEGANYIQLMRRKHILPIPPPNSIELTPRGTEYLEAYFTSQGEYSYLKDDGSQIVAMKAGAIEKKRGNYTYISDRNQSVDSFEPLSTPQRILLIAQFKKAYSRKKQTLWEQIASFMPYIACILILVMVFMFWGDLTKPAIEITASASGIAKDQAKTTQSQLIITTMLQDIIQRKQTITTEEQNRIMSNLTWTPTT